MQWLAVLIAGLGISLQLLIFGKVPWISLSLAFSFGLYGLIRKTLSIDPIAGLAVETLFALPFALAFIIWSGTLGDLRLYRPNHRCLPMFWRHCDRFSSALFHCRCITTKPYDNRDAPIHRADNISTYRDFLFLEPFNLERGVAFGFIWIALTIFSLDALRKRNKQENI